MIRVLYIHHGGGIGGAPLSLLYLIQQLDRRRYEPIVLTLKDGPVVPLYRKNGIETRPVTGIKEFSHTTLEWYGGRDLWRLPGRLLSIQPSIRKTEQLVRDMQPDIVHLNSSTLTPSAIGAARAGVPIIWHIREPIVKGYFGIRRGWIQRNIVQHGDRVVAISEHDANQLHPSDRVHVIHNFVDFSIFDRTLDGSDVRSELGIAPDAPVIVMLGGVAEPKGTLTLVRAIPALVAAIPDLRIIFAGPPPRPLREGGIKGLAKQLLGVNAYQKAVQQAVTGLSAKEKRTVIFTGIRQDMPQVVAASQCVVFPSSVPHFARPVIEAAAMAKPSVASNLGGPKELIIDGKTGYLVKPNDPQVLSAALIRILSNPEHAAAMGEQAYTYARGLFDAKTNAARTITLYDDILNQQ